METLATLAHRLPKKLTKAQALETLIEMDELLVEKIDNAADGKSLRDFERIREQMAGLYTYHLPPVPEKCRTVWGLLARTMAGKKEPREYLTVITATEEWLIAADGHRLVRVRNEGEVKKPVGFYDKAGNPVSAPSEDKVLAGTSDKLIKKALSVRSKAITVIISQLEIKVIAGHHAIKLTDNVWVQLKYLRDLFGKQEMIEIISYGVDVPVIFAPPKGMPEGDYIIMPYLA